MMSRPDDEKQGGLAPWAVRALGFNAKCECGHEDGLHSTRGKCEVIGCKCEHFRRLDDRR